MIQLPRPLRQQPASSELVAALNACRRAFLAIALFSGMSNLLMLSGALFMLEIYDRVLPSRSVPTLIALLLLVTGLYAAQGFIDAIRSRILVRVGQSLDESLSLRVYDTIVRLPLKIGGRGDGTQPVRDLDTVRGFLSGAGPLALFDLPWMPVYLAICFLFHTYIGLTALFGAIVLVTLTVMTEVKTRHPTRSATQFAMARNALLEASRRNAEAITAMGMTGRIARRWNELNRNYIASSGRAGDVTGGLGAASKVLRLLLQSAILAVGAWLVIHQESTPGIIIAGSILGARALAPVDLAIANWRGFVGARQSWQRLERLLGHLPPQADVMPLQAPTKTLAVQNAAVSPPGEHKIVCQDANFTLTAGKALGVIGPTASGKSSLARLLVGVWAPVRGSVRLDGATLDQWSPETLGRHIGYLPQDVELFPGNVAQNIARFEDPPNPAAVLAAAEAAGVHDMIVNLPEGYETNVGERGSALSAGQAQRIALARALYRDPFLVVLDEPNSNLDAEGDEALTQAILGLRARGAIVVVVAHRPSAIAGVDYILVMGKGRQQQFGSKEEVLNRVAAPSAPPRALKVVPGEGGAG
ncbi:MAG: type I secretion system permease/ATPase [Hyphomicrobiales bacterium]|nr:type I secretion system permease/ATPase [Hyphomicrobiales bacterium]MDE2373458.1 type I secretion system permease/ATPase [Hyphomicrobiales bacterium]